MPALSDSHAAAIRACVALLEAFDPNRSTADRREFMRAAIESALDATGVPKDSRPGADEIFQCFEICEVAETA